MATVFPQFVWNRLRDRPAARIDSIDPARRHGAIAASRGLVFLPLLSSPRSMMAITSDNSSAEPCPDGQEQIQTSLF
jgi:hypothetical protein